MHCINISAETWVDVENFGIVKEDCLSGFLELPNGIPSHDTFEPFFVVLDVEVFQTSFMRWVESVFRVTKGQVSSPLMAKQFGVVTTKASVKMPFTW